MCVDCGTAAAEALGFIAGDADIVVLDHHKAEGPPPAIVATVNPNRLDCTSGLSLLCAAAVAFLTAVATVRTLRRQGFFNARKEPDLIGLLDLVALATVCDVMPLTGVNRALVCQGLKVMARRARPGVAALLDVAQVARSADRGHLRLRARPAHQRGGADRGGRSRAAAAAVRGPGGGASLAAMLDAVNRQRQEVEAAMLDEAMRAAEVQAGQGHAALVISGPAWHPGVVGIVAGRIKERFNRPACVAGIADDLAKGSGRSVAGHDLGAAVIAARQAGILKTGGGHPMAAGFSLRRRGWRTSTPSSTNAWPRRRCCRPRPICRWRARWRCPAPRPNWRSTSRDWRRSAPATRSRCWCCSAPAWCAPTGSGARAQRSARSSKARAAGRG